MGIDIYAEWADERFEEVKPTLDSWAEEQQNYAGYIREAYHGEPYPSQYLVREAFHHPDGVIIESKTLRARLPETLRRARERERIIYGVTDNEEIEREVAQYERFVTFCEMMEEKLQSPPTIIAWW